MQRNVRRRASSLVGDADPWLAVAFLAVMIVGVLMVYSASIGDAYTYYGTPYYVIERELVFVVVGFVALFATAKIGYERWRAIAAPYFWLCFALLAVVLTHLGHMSHGARRWFSLGSGITLEPSELVKLALVIYLATWLPSKGEGVRSLQQTFAPFSLIVGAIFLLVVKQPDLGTAMVIGAIGVTMYYVGGADVRHMGIVAAGSVAVAWLVSHGSGYRHDRLTAFMNPWKDPTGAGYHTVQALLALGSGGLFGRGLGNSAGKFVLPAPHTDSILAIIGEETGLIGTVGILVLFLVIAYRGFRIATLAPDPFGRLLAAGITSWITFQALLNFAVITSSVPFTGVPLPFVSYGGTSLIITMAAMGILLNISRHTAGENVARHGFGHGRRNGRPPVPRTVGHPSPARAYRSSRPRVTRAPGHGSKVRRPVLR